MHLAGLWRYPVKSLGGERLGAVELTDDGITGDRLVHVGGASGLLTGRTRHALLAVPAGTGPDGAPLVAGHPWQGAEAARIVRDRAGDQAHLVAYDGPERFDVLNLLVATDGAVAAFGHDVRRLRPNLLIGGVGADAERSWPGRALAIGDTVIGVHSLRQRCVVTSVDPDTGDKDPDVYRRIRRDFAGLLALNCWVIRPGTLTSGVAVTLTDSDAEPAHVGGWVVGAPYRAGGGPRRCA